MSKTVTLEEAKAVIAAFHKEETRKRVAENRALIGKFFKYRNSYGSGEKWWLYVAVTGVDGGGTPTGWRFQRTSNDTVEIERKTWLSGVPNGGYQEITARAFWAEARKLRALLVGQLSA